MSELIESFRTAHGGLPSQPQALVGLRQSALDALIDAGLPGPRSEAWKYTSLRALARHRFQPAAEALADAELRALVENIPGPRAVFVNGRFNDALSALEGLPESFEARSMAAALQAGDADAVGAFARPSVDGSAVFALANSALAIDGLLLKLAPGSQHSQPIHLVQISDSRVVPVTTTGPAAGIAWHLRHQFVLGEGAEACLVQHELSLGQGLALGTTVCQLDLARSAAFQQIRLQQLGAGCSHFLRDDVTQRGESRYRRLDLELGQGLSRHELGVQLADAGAVLQADGVLLGTGSAHCDTRLGIVHAAGDTRCDLTWRGLSRDRSRVAFHGGITIDAGADGSEAMLSNKNLLLSEHAEVDTQPVLVIHADEVKAAHGATVGRLDPTALFYLRSRGLPVEQARRLLTAAFCRELLAQVDNETLRQDLIDRLDAALAREDLP
ncbi:SufB/SufD family protein [Pseudomarimonas arenosa]|uniref:SufD family Fe-S cluster assembly protein n=1 Tax=Pseudomarimonas arenosa TaxID=2774145 RepID=A0AAW3ZL80_9GAMM|nr:SufD family Fe-S cluster assembly protein [Pseudomarimonas arenosa]MBD8525942.1 SufD family Fe-S cluster assembly protein [Pseudomarimonas arenosa]